MKLTRLLREAQEKSKCSSNALSEAYKTILGMFSHPDHFSSYLRDELKGVRAQSHFKHGKEELDALEKIVEDLNLLNAILNNSQVKNKYGELPNFKQELNQNIADYTSQYQESRKKISELVKSADSPKKSMEDVVKIARYLCDVLEKEKYSDSILAVLSLRLANTREAMKVFNEEYADKIREKKYSERKDASLPQIDSLNDFIRGSDFEATQTNFSLDFQTKKVSKQGITFGGYEVRAVMRKQIDKSVSYSTQDTLKLDSEITPLKNLEKTDYDSLRAQNKGKIERIRNAEFLNELEKVVHVLSQAFELRLPRHEVSKILSQQTKLSYDDLVNPDTDYFKLKGENYSLAVGVKAKGKPNDHKVCVSLEYRKF
ncbi:MAG: hypothetical protein AABX39_02120 [Nanoarchaeota archaeon]